MGKAWHQSLPKHLLALTAVGSMCLLAQCADKKVYLEGKRLSLLEATEHLSKDPDADNMQVDIPAPEKVTTWAQSGYNASHVTPHATFGKNAPHIRWKESIGNGSDSTHFLLASPVVEGDLIYTMDSYGHVQARNHETGSLAWEFDGSKSKAEAPYRSGGGVCVAGHMVYAVTPLREVVALDKKSGLEIWRASITHAARSAPTVSGDRLYVATRNNHLVAFDAITGRLLWQHDGTPESTSFVGGASPAVHKRVVIVPYTNGEIMALRGENGHVLWKETLGSLRTLRSGSVLSQIRARPVVSDRMVFALSQGDRMMAIDLRTGRRVWDKEIGGIATPIVTENFIFALTNANQLICLIKDTGQVMWVSQLQRHVDPATRKQPIRWSEPILAGGHIVLAGSNGMALFVNPEDGKVDKTFDLGTPVRIGPIAVHGRLYFLARSGKLMAVEG